MNLYSKPLANPVVAGEPKAEDLPFLVQRSSLKFKDINDSPDAKAKGRAAFGIAAESGIVVMVQPHNPAGGGLSYYELRDKFIAYGCQSAFFVDGSDSVFLNLQGKEVLEAAYPKNSTQTSAISFKSL
ncbi:uncharacterized protein DUF2233 [Hydromonas duriensis]|uniref:Uncharacterized protein DUF2233 n=2 Tax=Hydromonas duriensis TaxID=1527608 RepID=A0A4R6XZW0_9BURK|nr:uncharacterized protein DUF2233 [Hydromonas duriensis]